MKDDVINTIAIQKHYGGEHGLRTFEVDPEVVRVEDLELANGLEVLDVLVWYLRDLEQTDRAIVVDEGTTLNIRLRLVRNLHDELGLRLDHVLEDLLIDAVRLPL